MNELVIKAAISIVSTVLNKTSSIHNSARSKLKDAEIELKNSCGDEMRVRSALTLMKSASNDLRKPMWDSDRYYGDLHHFDMKKRQNYNDLVSQIAIIHYHLKDDYEVVLHWANKVVNFPKRNPTELAQVLTDCDYSSIINRIEAAWEYEDRFRDYQIERGHYD